MAVTVVSHKDGFGSVTKGCCGGVFSLWMALLNSPAEVGGGISIPPTYCYTDLANRRRRVLAISVVGV